MTSSNTIPLKHLSKEEYKLLHLKASTIFLEQECFTSLKDMRDILSNHKYIINSKTGRPNTHYKYRMDLSGDHQDIQIENDEGKIVKFNKSKLLENKDNKNKIFRFYKSLNSYMKIYQDKYKQDIWWMSFSL